MIGWLKGLICPAYRREMKRSQQIGGWPGDIIDDEDLVQEIEQFLKQERHQK